MNKQLLMAHCLELMNKKTSKLQELIAEVQNASNQETKSTAGDKHDTSRAQAQIEVERLGVQLKNLETMQQELSRLSTEPHSKIQLGSFVKTNRGDFYLSVALGKIDFDNSSVFAVSIHAPVGKLLAGRSIGAEFDMPNGESCTIEEVF
jgi:transcription elongation GreA/GreB family factor